MSQCIAVNDGQIYYLTANKYQQVQLYKSDLYRLNGLRPPIPSNTTLEFDSSSNVQFVKPVCSYNINQNTFYFVGKSENATRIYRFQPKYNASIEEMEFSLNGEPDAIAAILYNGGTCLGLWYSEHNTFEVHCTRQTHTTTTLVYKGTLADSRYSIVLNDKDNLGFLLVGPQYLQRFLINTKALQPEKRFPYDMHPQTAIRMTTSANDFLLFAQENNKLYIDILNADESNLMKRQAADGPNMKLISSSASEYNPTSVQSESMAGLSTLTATGVPSSSTYPSSSKTKSKELAIPSTWQHVSLVYDNEMAYFLEMQPTSFKVYNSTRLDNLMSSGFAFEGAPLPNGNTISSNAGPERTYTGSPAPSSSGSKPNAGAIAGGVIGGVVAIALIAGLFFFCRRRRRHSFSKAAKGESMKLAPSSQNFIASRDIESTFILDESENLSEKVPNAPWHQTWLKEPPGVTHLTTNPGDRPTYEPNAPAHTTFMNASFELSEAPPVYEAVYAIRQCSGNKQPYTVHYFTQDNRDAFIRSVTSAQILSSPRIIEHHMAIALDQPTPKGYQYLWLTSTVFPHQSLRHFLFESTVRAIDPSRFVFQSWSVYSILNAIGEMHAQGRVHMNLNLDSFFYEKPSTITEWHLTGLQQSCRIGETIKLTSVDVNAAPEISTHSGVVAHPAMDIWALGCIVYCIATQRPLFDSIQQRTSLFANPAQLNTHIDNAIAVASQVHPSYQRLLAVMLQPLHSDRQTINQLASYWAKANELYEDDFENIKILVFPYCMSGSKC
ncbi:kinase-like domain-containing protein [Radiomyces spectabilis]|uniref:kinase-like domain-containing protein n=1 Tax=Radiomyces spectabilis TaxID=64574 RepID=UPI00221E3A85|nr:kinase-like domain-containing protein [Radiomyces spectabilis]KAI8393494.1 kinase-like domain-containing protein [Radiomyces spectabilis]